jgi:1-aminocyclopropane-1-carboxylate deaminase
MVQLPTPFADLPREELLFPHPSPIEQLSRLTAALEPGARYWIKREDCSSGLAFGGNKVRKLEYILPDAIAQGADTLVTTGGVQSNHMRQTAAAAARYGFKVTWCLYCLA